MTTDTDPPTCPHPYGSREAGHWWEGYFALRIANLRRQWGADAATQAAAEALNYGHEFYYQTDRCVWCGMSRLDFRLPTDEERWRQRERYTCRRVNHATTP